MARPDPRDECQRYAHAKSLRSTHEADWRMASAYCLPAQYNAWNTDGPAHQAQSSGAAARRFAFDNTGVRSLPKYVAILERLATPHSLRWHSLAASNRDLMKVRAVRAYFSELTDLLFKMRYSPRARFQQAVSEVWAALGVYGTGPMYMAARRPKHKGDSWGFMYKACALRDVYLLVDDDGEVTTVFRRFWLNVRQFRIKFPEAPMPPSLANASLDTAKAESEFVEFVHIVQYRTDHDAKALDARRHPWSSNYLSVKDQTYVGDETGYATNPYLTPRTMTVDDDPYGYSPAMQALPALGSVNAMKKTVLKQGQKAVDPTILAHDDGILNGSMNMTPGYVNYGAVNKDGKALVQALPVGNFRVAETLLADERRDIEDAFFVTLFQILQESPEMTATEVVERVAEKAALLAPTMGRVQSELLGPDIDREITVLTEIGMAPEMPPELIEAQGEYDVTYTSPLAKGMYAEEVSGFMRSVDWTLGLVERTQDPSHLDYFNFDEAIPEIAERLATPPRWMNDERIVQSMRDNREAKAEEQQLMDNAPALASVAKTAADMGTKAA